MKKKTEKIAKQNRLALMHVQDKVEHYINSTIICPRCEGKGNKEIIKKGEKIKVQCHYCKGTGRIKESTKNKYNK